MKGLEALSAMEYPGRFIALGKTNRENFVLYAVTGRSDSSQARRLTRDEKFDVVRTQVTDSKQLESGSHALLIYPAIFSYKEAIGVSNGYQTNLIYTALRNRLAGSLDTPAEVLQRAFRDPFYVLDEKEGPIDVTRSEPDKPNYTPRISGLIMNDQAGFHFSRELQGKSIVQLQLEENRGWFVTTYDGENINPLPAFNRNPIGFEMAWQSPREAAEELYHKILADTGKKFDKDFRVAVSAAFYNPNQSERKLNTFQVNRHDLGAR